MSPCEYTVAGLYSDTDYTARIRAVYPNGQSPWRSTAGTTRPRPTAAPSDTDTPTPTPTYVAPAPGCNTSYDGTDVTITVNAYTLPAIGQLPTHYEVRWRRSGGGEYILIRDLAVDTMGGKVETIHRSPATGFVYDYWVVAYRTDVATPARPSSVCTQDTRRTSTPVLTPTDTATPRPVVVSPVDARCVATAVVPAIGDPSANITFTHPASGQVGQLDPTHYRIFRSLTGTGNWFLLGEVPAGISPQTVVDQSVTQGVRYYYYIVAVNKAPGVVQVSQPSTPCEVYIAGAGTPTPPLVPPSFIAAPVFDCEDDLLLKPTNMVLDMSVLTITWSHRGDGTPANGAMADLFILEYRRPTQGLGQPITIGEIPGSTTNAVFMGLVRDDIYEFIITAVARPNSQHGRFMASARCSYQASAMGLPQATPAAIPTPADFRVIGWTDTSLVVGWNPPPLITDVTGYELRYRALGANTGWLAAAGDPNRPIASWSIDRPAGQRPGRRRVRSPLVGRAHGGERQHDVRIPILERLAVHE